MLSSLNKEGSEFWILDYSNDSIEPAHVQDHVHIIRHLGDYVLADSSGIRPSVEYGNRFGPDDGYYIHYVKNLSTLSRLDFKTRFQRGQIRIWIKSTQKFLSYKINVTASRRRCKLQFYASLSFVLWTWSRPHQQKAVALRYVLQRDMNLLRCVFNF